jgi:hypothetical protein
MSRAVVPRNATWFFSAKYCRRKFSNSGTRGQTEDDKEIELEVGGTNRQTMTTKPKQNPSTHQSALIEDICSCNQYSFPTVSIMDLSLHLKNVIAEQ